MNYLKLFMVCAGGMMLSMVGGCAKANVESKGTASFLHEPDMLIVNNFAVNPADVKLDRGLLAKTMREDGTRPPNEEETKVGALVSERLAVTLVDELREVGIKAVRPGPAVKPSDTTIILNGTFLTVDQGNQT